MGEAKRRLMATSNPIPLPDEIRRNIAAVVRSTNLFCGGGTCVFRMLCGHVVMGGLGIQTKRAYGAMLYRAGPDPMRDVVAFCAEGNAGIWSEDQSMGHAWLEHDGDLIDFSAGDWASQMDVVEALEADYSRANGSVVMESVRFDVQPPEYVWQSARPLKEAWSPVGEPAIGKFWYGPLSKRSIHPSEVEREMMRIVQTVTPALGEAARDFRLAKQVADWRRG